MVQVTGREVYSNSEKSETQCGVRLFLSDKTVLEIDDLCNDISNAEMFAKRLLGEWIDPEQLTYLVQDFLADIYTMYK